MTSEGLLDGNLALARASDAPHADSRTLFALLHQELRRHAHRLHRHDDESLAADALVSEAYLKLASTQPLIHDRQHFLALVARAMHQVIGDRVRERHAVKRGGDCLQVALDDDCIRAPHSPALTVDVIHALEHLATRHPRCARVFKLHHLDGLEFVQIGQQLGICKRTVARDWRLACALLRIELPLCA